MFKCGSSTSSAKPQFDNFTSLFCKGRQRNTPKWTTHARGGLRVQKPLFLFISWANLWRILYCSRRHCARSLRAEGTRARACSVDGGQEFKCGPRGLFLKSPETFRAYFGWHNSLCIFKTKASWGTKLCNYFYFYSLYNIWKNQLYRISGSEF